MTTYEDVRHGIEEIAGSWAMQRPDRQQRRHLEQPDFDALADAGLLLTMVPVDQGGLWAGVAESTRSTCSLLRTLAASDSSVALVSSMHPAVLSYWLANPLDEPGWRAQTDAAVASALAGHQWGTVTSEPGSGGDIARTRTQARPDDTSPRDVGAAAIPGPTYRLTGDKHFGSGTGIADFMFTTARPDDEDDPAAFVLDMRGADLATGPIRIVAEWDGAGMAATQSHSMRLDDMAATRLAWPGPLSELQLGSGGFILSLFTAVVLGVFDVAVTTARDQLAGRKDSLGSFERSEWVRAETEHWLAIAAYERLLTAIETGDTMAGLYAGLRAKTAVAELAESSLGRIARVIGGGAYARRSPFSHWYEDVRALGFLRPPWALAFDNLFATSLP